MSSKPHKRTASASFSPSPPPRPKRTKRAFKTRDLTLYDAIADRATFRGLIKPDEDPFLTPHQVRRPQTKLAKPPDEILARRIGAPDTGIPFPDEPTRAKLPDNELLLALLEFAAEECEKEGGSNWKSMDETALIALGILVEETMREWVGERGDLAFLQSFAEQSLYKGWEKSEDEEDEEDEGGSEVEREGSGGGSGSSNESEGRSESEERSGDEEGYASEDYEGHSGPDSDAEVDGYD